jgi:dTDP-4-dehydrorhamnose reductase
MRLLVIGGSGFLGQEIVRQARRAGHLVSATRQHSTPPPAEAGAPGAGEDRADWHRLDIRRPADVAALAGQLRPDVIVNTAYQQSDWTVTADGAAHVALAAVASGVRLVHVSTDALFAGRAAPYDETSPPSPVSPYGAAKAAAETAVAAITPDAVIARTSLIVGDGGSPQENLVRALAAGTVPGLLYTDEIRCPVHVTDLAAALLELAATTRAGVHHVAGPDAVSRHELGLLIAARDGLDPAALPSGPRPAGRLGPLEVRLDGTWTQGNLRTRLRGAREFLNGTA